MADIALGMLLIGGIFAILILAAAMPIHGILRWEGGWRWGACVALAIHAVPVLNVVIGVTTDPTSHNLWPLELLPSALVSVALSTVLLFMRRLQRR